MASKRAAAAAPAVTHSARTSSDALDEGAALNARSDEGQQSYVGGTAPTQAALSYSRGRLLESLLGEVLTKDSRHEAALELVVGGGWRTGKQLTAGA